MRVATDPRKTNARFFVEIPGGTNLAAVELTVELYDAADRYWTLRKQGATIYVENHYGDSTIPYDPVLTRWWQLRMAPDGATYVDFSSDGLTWSTPMSAGSGTAYPARGQIRLTAKTYQAGTPWEVHFDNLNVAP